MKAKIDPLYAVAMVIAVCAVSATAPLTAFASAPALALAFWRNGLGFATNGAIVTALRRGEFRRVYRGERGIVRREQYRFLSLGILASLCLAVHFATFMSSAKLTSVAMSTALVATQPIWQALIAVAQGQRLPHRVWIGLTVAVIGAAAAGGLDIRSGGNALLGDLLALVAAVAQAGYTALSERARSGLSTPLYSALSSFVCAIGLLVACLAAGTPLMHFDRNTGLAVLGLLILPQLLGLGSLNFALGRGSATTISVLLLLESPVAAVIAWLWMGQAPELSTLPGLSFIIVGAAVVVSSSTRQSESLIGRHTGETPLPSSAVQDPFAVAERETRAMVSADWWSAAPPQQRQNLIVGRMLALRDGSWWLFGAWGRWYRWTPADGQWNLCPPPRLAITRMSAAPLRPGMPAPPMPPHVVPTSPDLAYDPPSPLAFVDAGIRPEVTSRVRSTVESAAALQTPDYPHRWDLFSPSVPSTVPLTWGVMLWCATAPVFDSRLDAQLLGLWSAYRARPLPEVDGPRWLTPPPLESLIALYAGRLRAGRVDAAVVILRTMRAIASALREDVRFRSRADALIAMLGVTLQNPTADYGALGYGDQAVVQQWLTRCPPALAQSLRVEASAGEHFRNAYYDLVTAVTPVAGDPSSRGYIEPRLIAAALLAADLAVVRQDVSSQIIGSLDPQVSEVMRAMLIQRDHPLRPLWPQGDRLPRSLREHMGAVAPSVRSTLLATMYGADLAWCRLGGIPARPRGFPSSVAILAEIIGPRRAASASSSELVAQSPGIVPLAHQHAGDPLSQRREAK
jgi:drug/metabolite transporter (DMT)-like permease